jgi:hypothetical protein
MSVTDPLYFKLLFTSRAEIISAVGSSERGTAGRQRLYSILPKAASDPDIDFSVDEQPLAIQR